MITSNNPPSVSNMKKIASATGATFEQAIDFNALNARALLLIWDGASGAMNFWFNNDETAANYYTEVGSDDGTSVGCSRPNTSVITNGKSFGTSTSGHAFISLNATAPQFITAWGQVGSGVIASKFVNRFHVTHNSAQTNITEVKCVGTDANQNWTLYALL